MSLCRLGSQQKITPVSDIGERNPLRSLLSAHLYHRHGYRAKQTPVLSRRLSRVYLTGKKKSTEIFSSFLGALLPRSKSPASIIDPSAPGTRGRRRIKLISRLLSHYAPAERPGPRDKELFFATAALLSRLSPLTMSLRNFLPLRKIN